MPVSARELPPPTLAAGASSRPSEAPPAPAPEVPPDEVSLHVARAAQGRQAELHLRLQPAALGRVDIRLEFEGETGVRVHIRAEDGAALELLQRHGHQLERALAASGLDLGRDGVRYDLDQQAGRDLRQGPSDQHRAQRGDRADGTTGEAATAADAGPEPPASLFDARRVLDVHA